MGQFLSTLKSGRVAVVALALGAAAVAMPTAAEAQSFSFNFGINGGGSTFSYGLKSGKRVKRECLSRQEVRRGLRDAGFYDIEFYDQTSKRFELVATWERNDKDYSMKVARCTGEVYDIRRVRNRFDIEF